VHFAQQWVSLDLMRPLLEKRLGYQNPIYLAMRRTEQKKPVLSAFLNEIYQVHQLVPAVPARLPEPHQAKPKKSAKILLPI
jgi:hypothetical protein